MTHQIQANGRGGRQRAPLPPERPLVRHGTAIESRSVDWLWKNWIAKGKYTLLGGHPGQGKSSVAAAIAAALTQGLPLPGEHEPPEPVNVLVVPLEESIEEEVQPRLQRYGADMSRVSYLKDIECSGNIRGLKLPRDQDLLLQAIRETNAGLVILDPVVELADPELNMHVQREARLFTASVRKVAENSGAGVLVLTHLRKGPGAGLLAFAGSIDLPANARVAAVVGIDPSNPTRRALAWAKGISTSPQPVGFRLTADGHFEWAGPESDLTLDKLIGESPIGQDEKRDVPAAVEFIRLLLSDGPIRATKARDQIRRVGISHRVEREARHQLQVNQRPLTRRGRGSAKGAQCWYWLLPGQSLNDVVPDE